MYVPYSGIGLYATALRPPSIAGLMRNPTGLPRRERHVRGTRKWPNEAWRGWGNGVCLLFREDSFEQPRDQVRPPVRAIE